MFSDKHKIIYFRLFNNLNLDVKGRSEINKKVIIIRTRHGKRFLLSLTTTARKRFQNALLRSREQKEKKNSTDKTYIQSNYTYLQHSSFQK